MYEKQDLNPSDGMNLYVFLSFFQLVNGLDGIPRCICETEVIEDMNVATNGVYSSPENHTSKNANGNIITLTLKNNHLIVETEEREVLKVGKIFISFEFTLQVLEC